MKKLTTPSKPTDAMPETYKSIVESDSNPFDSFKAPVIQKQESMRELPPKTLYNHNLKRLKSYRNF